MIVIWHLAAKEIRDGLRNRWIAATVLTLAGLALTLALLGAAPGGGTKASALSVTVVSLSSLSVYLLPLIALMLAYDAVVGELERGTLLLLLSYPVKRWQVVLGKFLGHVAILGVAIVLGYGSAALAVFATDGADAKGVSAFAALCGSSVLLGGTFLALGYVLSALCEERARAAGLAIGLWLFLVVIYDLGLLGLLLLDAQQAIAPPLFAGLLLANPADAFRVFNMTLIEGVRQVGGLAGLGAEAMPHRAVPIAILFAWALAALGGATVLLARREL
jgi:Cu-processing system permease protein